MATVIEIERLTLEERLELYEKLVESLTPDRRFAPSPAWHGEVLTVRERLEQAGQVKFAPLDEVMAQFRRDGLCK
jgi:hypothetical protein